ncbi:MAG: AMP-binding protein [Burkholderiales bacterium]|nr:AMP-binding protein [Burkholderiales bacterium]
MDTPLPIPLDAPLHEYLRAHARRQPAKPAFLWYGAALSYAELDRASDAFAARLAALGVARGEPVALFMGNCPQYVIAHVGIQKLGAIVCPCGPLYKEHELQYQLADLQARVIVAAAPLLPTVDKVRASTALAHVFVVHYADLLPGQPGIDVPAELLALRAAPRDIPPGCEDFLAVVQQDLVAPAVTVSMDEVALMTYTSGTTGLPKGAMLSFDNALYKTAAAAGCNGVTPDAVLLAIAPLYHIAGMLMGINVTLFTGATTVLMHRFDPLATLQAIARHRVSWWYSIAPMNVACMAVPTLRGFDLTSLRFNPVTSFGITFTEGLAKQWREHAPNCESFEAAYGLSETHTCDTYMPREAIRWGTHGKPAPGVHIRIIDPDTGADRPAGEVGEIILKSRGSFKGYWNKPEATEKTLRDGWVHTGDMGTLSAEGYLTFIGRFKEMIKVSGYSVFPEEVETILIKHPAVAQAACIAIADAEKGEVVRAFIVCKPGQSVNEAALIAWARENMASYKAPRSVRFIDALPATGAGKVLRRLLKDHP